MQPAAVVVQVPRHVVLRAAAMALLALVVIGAIAFASTRTTADEPPTRLRVVVTTGMVADLVRGIAGDRVELIQLIGSGVDPHLYSPTRRDILQLESANVILHNGFLLEGRLGEAITRASSERRPAHAVAELVVASGYEAIRDGETADPHLWMDVTAWRRAVTVIAGVLATADARHADHYRAAAEGIDTELAELDRLVREAVTSVEPSRRVLVTAHDAFAYFGRAYGVEVHGIQGISTESEAGVRRVTELTDLLVARGVPAVFVESTVADRSVRALVEAAAARGHRVEFGGELFSDAMGTDGTYRGTYLGMIDHNATTIVRALGGKVPPRGLRGKLESDPRAAPTKESSDAR